MIDTLIYIVDSLLFLTTAIIGLYLFVLTIISRTASPSYPQTSKAVRCVILIPEGSNLPDKYQDPIYEFVAYRDLCHTIQLLDNSKYDLVLILSEATESLSADFLERICEAYGNGVKAMQLHSFCGVHRRFYPYIQNIQAEIANSLYGAGNVGLSMSSHLLGYNMAIDLHWLKDNFKNPNTNVEHELLQNRIYIGYLPGVKVYGQHATKSLYRTSWWKLLITFFASLFENNWNFCNRIIQQLIPTPLKMCILVGAWTLLITLHDSTSFLGWSILFFGILITYSLAIPDDLVKNRKKYSIWKRKASNNT